MMSLPVALPRGGSSLVRRLAASYAFLVVLILLTGMSGALALTVSLVASDRIVDDVVPAQRANATVQLDLTTMQSGVRGFLISGDSRLLEPVRGRRAAWSADERALRGVSTGRPWAASVARELRRAEAWIVGFVDPVLDQADRPGGLAEVRRTRDAELSRSRFASFQEAAATVDGQLQQETGRLRDRSTSIRRLALGVLLAVAALAMVLGSLAAVRTAADVVRPLSRLRRTVEALTAGHDARADADAGPTEVRAVAAAMNALFDERARARLADEHRAWARRLAHDVGLRIRERIDVAQVTAIAVEELGTAFAVDRVLLRRLEGGRLGPVVSQWREVDAPELANDVLRRLETAGTAGQAEALWADVRVLTGTRTPHGALPEDEEVAEVLRVCDAASCVVAAFGAGRDTLGTVTLLHHSEPISWSEAQVTALESIMADLGRSLQHALLYQQERTLVDQLREVDRTKTDFLSTISHELRTPLTSITGYIELLRDGSVEIDTTSSHMLDAIERNSYRLTALIEDLLTLSRIESGAARMQRVPVDVSSLVRNACADIEPAALEAGLRLDLVPGPAVHVPGDPGQLDRVLLNLLSNAVKFTPPGGGVRVSWTVARGDLLVAVADTGIGIPESEAHQLAARFFRASNAMSAAIPGTGLGLAIVRGILDLHGGSLAVVSSPAGTRVTVRLPGAGPAGAAGGTRPVVARL